MGEKKFKFSKNRIKLKKWKCKCKCKCKCFINKYYKYRKTRIDFIKKKLNSMVRQKNWVDFMKWLFNFNCMCIDVDLTKENYKPEANSIKMKKILDLDGIDKKNKTKNVCTQTTTTM